MEILLIVFWVTLVTFVGMPIIGGIVIILLGGISELEKWIEKNLSHYGTYTSGLIVGAVVFAFYFFFLFLLYN